VTVPRYEDAHAELLYHAVKIPLESFELSLICRNTKYVLALGANEPLDRFELSGRGRIEKTCLSRRLNLLERAARSRQAEE
jgi:hypothetical protein